VADGKARPDMSDQLQTRPTRPSDLLEPVNLDKPAKARGSWSEYLILFLRLMALISLAKGLHHWWQICGTASGRGFEAHALGWQAATVFFAVIDLVAAVGLWLASAWGAVVWLASVVSMAVLEIFFPRVYGGSLFVILVEATLLAVYLWLAIFAARERPR
jgi:uncharacterized membrane protein (DUF2068 family)